MKIYSIPLILLVSANFCFGQETLINGVSVSTPYKTIDLDKNQFVIDQTVYSLKTSPKKKILQLHSGENFDLTLTKEIENLEGSLNDKPIVSENKIGFLGRKIAKKTSVLQYYEFDSKSNSFLPPVVLPEKGPNRSSFQISKDGSHFIVFSDNVVERYAGFTMKRQFTHDKVQLFISLYNSDIEEIWNKTITMPFDDSQYKMNSIHVNNSGEIFLFCTIFHTENRELNNKNNEKTADQVCYYILDGEAIPIEMTFLSKFNKVTSIKFVSDKKGNEYLAGIYQEASESVINYQGCFLSKFEDGQFSEAQEIPFDQEIVDQYSKPGKNQERVKPYSETANLSIKNVEFFDNSVSFLLNQAYSYIVSNGKSSYVVYANQDIIIAHQDLKTSETWTIKIPKNQTSRSLNKNELGYIESTTGDYTYVLYVDHKNNFDLPKNETPSTHVCGNGGFLTVCRINNKSGEIDKKHVLQIDKFNGGGLYQLSFDRFSTVGEKVVFEAYVKGKKDQMITLDYTKIFN